MLLLGLVHLTLFVCFDFLRFPPEKDELHFWPTALSFSHEWMPSLDALRNYRELSTPLPFLVFGGLEHWLHAGIMAGRLLNLLLSFGVVAAIGLASDDVRRSSFAALGLLVFPYYLGVSAYLYTDVITAVFVLLGLICHRDRKPVASTISWSLAIASRQFAVAFPLAIAAYELCRRDTKPSTAMSRWIAPAAGAATLGAWIWLFGGAGPRAALAQQEIGQNRLLYLHPSHIVYLLACVGLFYVIPEFLLFRDTRRLRHRGWPLALIAVTTVLSSVYFPAVGNAWGPTTMGLFDRLMSGVLNPVTRVLLYGGLATLATVRFCEYSLASFLVAANAAILLVSPSVWEKYALLLLVSLWYLRARGSPA